MQIEWNLKGIHYQRKQLTQFWRGLALLLMENLIARKAAFRWWQRGDVDIVIKVLLPIEDHLADFLETPWLSKLDPIYYLVKNRNKFY